MVFEGYVRAKTRTLTELVKRGILLSGYNWAVAPPASEIRTYIIEILLDLADVYFECNRISANTARQAVSLLSERLGELLVEHVRFIDDIGNNGAFQLHVEFKFIKIALRNFYTQRFNAIFENLQEVLATRNSSFQQVARMNIQFLNFCFRFCGPKTNCRYHDKN